MGYAARVLTDSISPDDVRLTTLVVTFPRIVLAEFNTHRMLSRNSASSRAIPIQKQIDRLLDDPFEPIWWGKNQPGMQADEELEDDPHDMHAPRKLAQYQWNAARLAAIDAARGMMLLNVHKQIVNRLLEPFMWHTVVVTATEWANFFALRCHRAAQPEMRRAAELMREAYHGSTPTRLHYGEWHLPFVDRAEMGGDFSERWIKVSCGRCARVSYLTHEGKRDPQADAELADKLAMAGHMSPFEHAARPLHKHDTDDHAGGHAFVGNFKGWLQYRKTLPHEANFALRT